MKITRTFLTSKVGRRIFLLFVLCAIVPIGLLSIFSFSHVTSQLNKQSQERLDQSSKSIGMTIYERLLSLESEMKTVAAGLDAIQKASASAVKEVVTKSIRQRFGKLAILASDGSVLPIWDNSKDALKVDTRKIRQDLSPKTMVLCEDGGQYPPHLFMAMAINPDRPERGILVGEIDNEHLWSCVEQDKLPAMTELFVIDQSRKVLFSTIPLPPLIPDGLSRKMNGNTSGEFGWDHEGVDYQSGYWSIFLESNFVSPMWTVVLNEEKSHVYAPVSKFAKTFLFVILLSFWVVLLLSVVQIQKTMAPLEKLQEGTERISMKQFDSRVTVSSNDEFQSLANAFNSMAQQLGRQFNALTTMAEIDRTILSSLDTEKIVQTVVSRMNTIIPSDTVSMILLDPGDKQCATVYEMTGDRATEKRVKMDHSAMEDLEEVRRNPGTLVVRTGESLPRYLRLVSMAGSRQFVVFPVMLKQKLSGIVVLGYVNAPSYSEEDLAQVRQLTNQIAVALSNSQLLEELDRYNWGTIRALARAVDAKSPWTAGHSERVTEVALKIGREMGLTQKELTDLHRGALLHDIGKIGVPARILDKPGKLDDEEYALVQQHSRVGSRILEPIEAYGEILPFVLQHHERFDGKGYPDGLAGEEIVLGARILAVADVYDAMVSDRPYRKGMGRERALQIIKGESGRQFDPEVVRAFLRVMAAEEDPESKPDYEVKEQEYAPFESLSP